MQKPNADEVKPGTILQIVPEDAHDRGGRLIVVVKVESWGAEGYIPGGDPIVSRTWSLLEPTGGTVVFDRNGKRQRETRAPAKHHP